MAIYITTVRLRTAEFLITVVLPVGETLLGKELRFVAKTRLTDDNAIFTKSSPSDGITISEDGLTASLVLDPTDTQLMKNKTSTPLECELVLVSGSDQYSLDKGTLYVLGNVDSE